MKIMIIDDEPDIRTYLMTALEDNGYESCTVDENSSIHEAILTQKPDLIILDIMMPRRSGISIYKELRNTPSFGSIPIALISGMTSGKKFLEGEFRELIDDDTIVMPDGFIEKPVQLPVLLRLVESIFASES